MSVIKELLGRYYRHDVGRSSAALTYYLIFAALPLMIFFSTLLGLVDLDPESVLQALDRLVPEDVEQLIRSYLIYVQEHQSRQLLWFSLVFSIWFPMRATGCLLVSMQRAFNVSREGKSVLKEQLRNLLFTVWMIVTLAAAAILVVVGRRALTWLSELVELPLWLTEIWNSLRFVLLALVMLVSLSVLYMVAQGSRRPMRKVLPGVLASMGVWLILSAAFSFYVENFATYSQLYGTIATTVVTLLWIYMGAVVVIMGAELNAVLVERKEKKQNGTGEQIRPKSDQESKRG